MIKRIPPSVWMCLVVLIAAGFVLADPAFAAPSGPRYFSCYAGHARGSLYDTSAVCPTTLKASNVFSFLVCNMERLTANMMGEVYCGMIQALKPMVMAVLTMSVLFFGVGFTVGVIPATAKEFQVFLLKIAFVLAFATKADYLIGTGYNFLVTGLREGITISLNTLYTTPGGGPPSSAVNVYEALDKFLGKALSFATDYVGVDPADTPNRCKNAIFAVLAVMAVAFPPVFYMGVIIIFRVAVTFMRAVFGYIYSIVGMVFLLALSPFFLSFYLFRATRGFFDKWLGYLVSFTFQMVLLFAFLSFLLSLNVKNLSGSLTEIIMPVSETKETMAFRAPWKYCTLCDFKVLDKDGAEVTTEITDEIIKGGKLQCKTPKTPIKVESASGTGGADAAAVQRVQNALISFTVSGLLSLLVLAYIIEYLLNYAPQLASYLAGGMGGYYAPQLGGGNTAGQKSGLDMPGGDFVDTFEKGFTAGYRKDMGKTSVVSAAQGVTEGIKWMIVGGPRREDGQTDDPGLVDQFTRFIMNPHRDRGE